MTHGCFTVVTERDETVLALAGELDLGNAREFCRAIQDYCAQVDPQPPVLDFTHVRFIDSSGLHALVKGSNGVPGLVIRNPSAVVQRTIAIVLPGVFRIEHRLDIRGDEVQEPRGPLTSIA